ncbi:hypothetical protein [Nibrella viscosa]|uniref:hypothetical protein n=1 Tax=Nibrella viscosa TaxID=1084524 RepID=UPI0031EBCDBB
MRPVALLLICLGLLTGACRQDKTIAASKNVRACGVKDPANNLPWLRQRISDIKQGKEAAITTITMITLNNQDYFNIYMSYMSCIGCLIYRCDGTQVDQSKLTNAERMEIMRKLGTPAERIIIYDGSKAG